MLERQQGSTHYGRSESAGHLLVFLALKLTHRFKFPSEPSEDIIDLTMSEQPFYFNPYSGELSLEFPKAEIKCPGGILA